MKRIITYISILAAVVTAGVSCSREISFDENQDGGKITLHFLTEKMGTRVTVSDPATPATVAGVGAENVIDHLDYFFFADDNPTSEAIVSGRLSASDLTPVVVEGNETTEYTYDGFDTSESEFEDSKGPSYLYVLVNYPEEVTVKTMGELLALPISTDFTEAQTSFVMDSYDNAKESALLYLSPKSSGEEREVEVKLSRVAAKLVLNFHVLNSFTDEVGNVWTPVTDKMWANFLHGRTNATVAAAPIAFNADKDNLFDTERTVPTSITALDANHTSWTIPAVYTYPLSYNTSDVTAPYFKIFCPWTCEKRGLNNFYYKIILPELGSFQRNKIYTVSVDVSVVGSTEEDWVMASDYVFVADWWAPQAVQSSYEGAMYLDVPVKEYTIYGVDDVYIPVLSSNDIQITQTATSNSTTINGTKTNLYSGNDETVTGSTSQVTKDGFKFTHTLNNDITSDGFDCTPITFEMYVRHTTGGLSKTVKVKVIQYPSIYAKADASNGYAYVNSYAYTSNHGGRYSSGYSYNSRGTNTNGSDRLGSMANISDSENQNSNQYVVSVSVLPSGYKVTGLDEEVVIGDPRGGDLTYNYLGYYGNGANGARTLDVQSKYDAVSSSTQHVIAPALRIASSWGATTQITNFNRAEERCAAYQENGYPAGRWRLPTVAEIDFLIRLSTYEHIPALFTTRTDTGSTGGWGGTSFTFYWGYWAGGTELYLGKPYTDNNHSVPFENMQNSTEYVQSQNGDYNYLRTGTSGNYTYYQPRVRCVYDEWYWSDQKYGSNGQPSTTAATQWIGYIF